ncbi:MAG: Rv1355c family protein [Myxococcales bacterium]|nr:Rv1355c family protein [Myxococcales bacterium]
MADARNEAAEGPRDVGRPGPERSPPHEEILADLADLCVTHHHGSEMWRPRMFRAQSVDDALGLVDLLRSCAEIVVFDTLGSQLRELAETRSPGRPLTPKELTRSIEQILGGVSPLCYGVWVYYPWSRRLVHILDRAEFIELRTNRNQHKITSDEQRLLGTKKVGIVGQSVGQSVALTMAMERSLGEIRLADFDTLGLSNLNRLRAGLHNLGVPKVYITAREIAEIDPYIVVKCYPDGVAQDTIDDFLLSGGRLDLLIDECDSLDIKVWLRHHARYHRIPVLMETSDRGLIDIERFDIEPDRPLFHGLVGDLHPEQLGGLSTGDKIPYVLQIIGEPTMSDRARASMLEVGHTIKTWPQLASAVTLGGGAAADVARRMNLGMIRHSGRYWADIESIVPSTQIPAPVRHPVAPPRPLEVRDMLVLAKAVQQVGAPPLRVEPAQRDRLLGAAIAAPSGGNSQPWRWLAHGDRLHLFRDPTRAAALADFRGHGALVALGAAIENLVLAAHAEALEVGIQLFPLGEGQELVASLSMYGKVVPGVEPHWHDELVDMIAVRHTNRRSRRERLPTEVLAELVAALRSIDGADVHFLETDQELADIGELVGAGDRLRFLDERCNQELLGEICWTTEEAQRRRDGLDLDGLELGRGDRAALQMLRSWSSLQLIRGWGGGRGFVKAGLQAITGSAAVGLITMPRGAPGSYVLGGRAMERMWLTAQRLGLAVHPMTTLPYLFARVLQGGGEGLDPATSEEARGLRAPYVGLFPAAVHSAEVLLFRVSQAAPTPARSLRRSVADVLVVA